MSEQVVTEYRGYPNRRAYDRRWGGYAHDDILAGSLAGRINSALLLAIFLLLPADGIVWLFSSAFHFFGAGLLFGASVTLGLLLFVLGAKDAVSGMEGPYDE